MNSIYTLEIILEIRDGSGINADEVVERTIDAIFAYEDRGRLFAGRKLPGGESWITGTSACATKIEKKPDTRPAPMEEALFRQRFPFWDECYPDTNAATDIMIAIDRRIEELREIEARLGEAKQAMTDATDRKAMVAARRKLRAMMATVPATRDQPIHISNPEEG